MNQINQIDYLQSEKNQDIYSIEEYIYENQSYALVSGCGGFVSIYNFVCVNGVYTICKLYSILNIICVNFCVFFTINHLILFISAKL